ncbi:hypothetical protein OsJ_35492 [Oryza sativa Japonica Group]|uniref:Uncharacterized protein n=2 Tax=Oryza sativa subsp. japonica TaxID=39947 RepID=A0A8J8XJN0_ORYSJ|nr:hypothetical protein LOC_Os12g09050 [Oryza sativa Japonica Group]EAZ19899.1 hypothetical protein OsJ_35492 [Oryza sativa Japonica Group]
MECKRQHNQHGTLKMFLKEENLDMEGFIWKSMLRHVTRAFGRACRNTSSSSWRSIKRAKHLLERRPKPWSNIARRSTKGEAKDPRPKGDEEKGLCQQARRTKPQVGQPLKKAHLE